MTGPVANIGFEGIAPVGGFTAFDTTGGLDRFGVNFVGVSPSNSRLPFYLRVVDPLFYPGYYDWGSGPVLHGPPVPLGPSGEGGSGSHLRVTFPGNVTAVGSDIMSFLAGASPFTVIVATKAEQFVFSIGSLSYPNRAFVGFTSTVPIDSLSFYANNGFPVLDNVAFGYRRRSRTTQDQPDDMAGSQVHAIYAVPSDGVDEQFDMNGVISNSVAAFQSWLRGQTAGRGLRFDTFGQTTDITFFRLPRTDADIRSHGAFIREEIERELSRAGLLSPNKIYAVYYGGSSDVSCGGASWPPTIMGQVVAMYLHGRPPGAPACDTNVLGASPVTPGYFEFGMLHELIHGVGFVAVCAPNHTLSGHVSNDPTDLMYAGPLPWRPAVLDVGRDDYFAHSNSSCPDLEDSPYLASRPREDVAVDFGSLYGIWILQNGATAWRHLHGTSPEAMVRGDLDGNGLDDLVIDFGSPLGVWVWMNHATWFQLHALSPTQMVTGDLDNNERDEVILDFPGYGVWIWRNNTTWTQLHQGNAGILATGNLDGSAGDDVIIDFPEYGIYVYANNNSWTRLHSLSATTILTADLDGNGRDDVVMDFPGYGLWIYQNNATWGQLHSLSAAHIVAGDIDGSGRADLVIDFRAPYGVWTFRNNMTWVQLHGLSTEAIVLADHDASGRDEVIVDFGAPYGLWQYANDTRWSQLHPVSPEIMEGGRFH